MRQVKAKQFVTALSAAALLLGVLGASAEGQVADKKALTLEGAKAVIAAAEAHARAHNAPGGVIAVVDDGGNLIALERLDGTFAAGANISIGKARTAALFQKPTRLFEDIVNKGRTTMVALPDFTPLQGGVPVSVGDQVVGAVGVSGAASAQQDEEIALAGAAATSAGAAALSAVETRAMSADPVTYFGAERVAAAFAAGAPLLETSDYKVHASRRTEAGLAEVHQYETDVFYVLEGAATFVTGGALVAPKVVAPGEIRGASIEGGDSRRIARGDVIVIPRGTPHWFNEVEGTMHYFVVKPISGAPVAR